MKIERIVEAGIFAACASSASRAALKILLLSGMAVWAASLAQAQQPPENSAAVPVAKAGAGPCMADFTVRDASGKGVYNAKITLQLQYGFLGVRKLDLNVGTNYEGKAEVDGLPEKTKRAAEFKISHGNVSKTVPYDPLNHCYSQNDIMLDEQSETKAN
jgi:hypothetical protein